MGNLKKWGGPLSAGWHRQQMQLQKKIVARMTALGMIPVLPAFAGFVPRALKHHFPKAKIRHSPSLTRPAEAIRSSRESVDSVFAI